MPLLTARSLAWRAQVCGEMLYSVAADGPHRDGGICKERPRRPDHVAAALAILCGRPLAAVVRQFAPSDSKLARSHLEVSAARSARPGMSISPTAARRPSPTGSRAWAGTSSSSTSATTTTSEHTPHTHTHTPKTVFFNTTLSRAPTGQRPDGYRLPARPALHLVALILPSLCACTWPQQSTRPLLGIWGSGRIPDRRDFPTPAQWFPLTPCHLACGLRTRSSLLSS